MFSHNHVADLPFQRQVFLKIPCMLNNKDTELINELTEILKKHNIIGFAGTFRDGEQGKYVTIKIEHPLYRDGACMALGAVLEHYIQLMGYGFGEFDKCFAGRWPAQPDTGEMPT
jgi:hypothetical protein